MPKTAKSNTAEGEKPRAKPTQKVPQGRVRNLPDHDFTRYGTYQFTCDTVTTAADSDKMSLILFGTDQGSIGEAVAVTMSKGQWHAVVKMIRAELKHPRLRPAFA